MSVHPDPETLAAVAAGEPVTPDLQAHLAACPDCSGHVDALRALTTRLESLEPVEWADAPEGLWQAVSESVHTVGGPADASPTTADRAPAVGGRRRWIAVAAAVLVGVVAGVLGARLWTTPDQPVVVAVADLQTLDDHRSVGKASLLRSDGALELSVQTQPLDPGAGYLEVWLLNRDGERMVSLGILADRSSGVFPVSSTALAEGYLVVDISREAFDDKPAHSGVSLARGVLRL